MAAIVRYPVALLCLLGALTRFPGLAYPREVVFDEVTFGKDVAAYCCTGQRIFDVHPPHAKLLIAAAAKLGGFTGTFTFDRIGLPYGDQPVVALRFVPALAGALIPVVFYLFLIQLNASRPLALLGGILVALDNALIAETRIIVFDGILVAATFGALACFFAAERRAGIGWQLVTAGLLAGLAVGTKTTGLAALGVMGMSLLVGAGPVSRSPASRLKQGIVIAAGAFGVYAAGWLLHGLLLTSPGPADAFYPTSGHMLEDLLTAHRTMLERNFAVVGGHPDASRAWTWPWMKVVPFLWKGEDASIYMVGNPVVWWGSTLVLLGIPAAVVITRAFGIRVGVRNRTTARPWIALGGYAIAYAPLWPITRVSFMYHYFTPLLFALAFGLLWLERAGWVPVRSDGRPRTSAVVVLGLGAVGFLLVSPLTYGVSIGAYDEWLAGIIRAWR